MQCQHHEFVIFCHHVVSTLSLVQVSFVSIPEVIKSEAYLLCYERMSADAPLAPATASMTTSSSAVLKPMPLPQADPPMSTFATAAADLANATMSDAPTTRKRRPNM
jgi:hypothetical protein